MDPKRILVADDIATNRLLLSELIRSTGNEVVLVDNGEKVIEALKQQEFHLVFMDIEMPVMNGLETTKYIRDKLTYPKNKTKVIALTAHNPDDFFEDYNNAGFDELLTKPYSFEKIIGILSSLDLVE